MIRGFGKIGKSTIFVGISSFNTVSEVTVSPMYIPSECEVDCQVLVQMAKAFPGQDGLFYIIADRDSTQL